VANQWLGTFARDVHDRWRQPATLGIGYNIRNSRLDGGDEGIGSAKINADNAVHGDDSAMNRQVKQFGRTCVKPV
jgi:hypothetical protein